MTRLTDELRRRLAREQRDRCFYCSLRFRGDMTFEHLVARADGGSDKTSNLRICHSACNSLVGTLDVRRKHALAEVGATFGSDAFFILAQRLKPHANVHVSDRRFRQRRPKRPPAPVHRENVLNLVSQLPEELRLLAA